MKQKTIILFGGNSDERLVSVASAQNLAEISPESLLWYMDKKGQVYQVTQKELLAHKDVFTKEFQPKESVLHSSLKTAIKDLKNHIVFIGLHGTEGEDGQLQSLFEQNEVAFTASGSRSSHICFDKLLAKKTLQGHGIMMAEQRDTRDLLGDKLQKATAEFWKMKKQIVAKPVANGSSFGLHIIQDELGLEKFQLFTKTHPNIRFMLEEFITGREITCGVIDRGSGQVALPASEVVLDAGSSFDYEGKYLGRGTKELTPAPLDKAQMAACQKLALQCHQTFDCYGLSRTDMVLTNKGPCFLETNTLPGLTRASFIPQQLAAAEIGLRTFFDEQIESALHRPKN